MKLSLVIKLQNGAKEPFNLLQTKWVDRLVAQIRLGKSFDVILDGKSLSSLEVMTLMHQVLIISKL